MRKRNHATEDKTAAIIKSLYNTIADLEDARMRLRKTANGRHERQPSQNEHDEMAEQPPARKPG